MEKMVLKPLLTPLRLGEDSAERSDGLWLFHGRFTGIERLDSLSSGVPCSFYRYLWSESCSQLTLSAGKSISGIKESPLRFADDPNVTQNPAGADSLLNQCLRRSVAVDFHLAHFVARRGLPPLPHRDIDCPPIDRRPATGLPLLVIAMVELSCLAIMVALLRIPYGVRSTG